MQYDIYTERLVSVPEPDVLSRFFGILFETVDTALDLCDYISDAVQVYGRGLKLVLRFGLTALVEHDTRRFFKYLPSVLGLCAYDIGYFALSDDRIALYSYAGIHEELTYVSEPAWVAVDEIFALARPEHASGDGDFVVFERKYAARVVYHECDLSHALRLSGRCTRENDVLHLGSAELL